MSVGLCLDISKLQTETARTLQELRTNGKSLRLIIENNKQPENDAYMFSYSFWVKELNLLKFRKILRILKKRA